MIARPLLALAVVTLPALAGAQARPAASHDAKADSAAIVAARRAFQAVEAAMRAKALRQRDTTITCDDGREIEHELRLDIDSAGVVRRLTWDGGTDDMAFTTRWYYDASARLRFAFHRLGAVNGSEVEERVYWDDAGRVVRRLRTLVKGPGYPEDEVEAVPDPRAWIARFCEP